MTLTPLVYWAQRHEEIYLRVELTDAQVSGCGTGSTEDTDCSQIQSATF